MEACACSSRRDPAAIQRQPWPPAVQDRPYDRAARAPSLLREHHLADGVNIKELSEYLGHADSGFTLQMYTHLLPSSYDRARQAVDRRLARVAPWATEQRRSRADPDAGYGDLDDDPGLL